MGAQEVEKPPKVVVAVAEVHTSLDQEHVAVFDSHVLCWIDRLELALGVVFLPERQTWGEADVLLNEDGIADRLDTWCAFENEPLDESSAHGVVEVEEVPLAVLADLERGEVVLLHVELGVHRLLEDQLPRGVRHVPPPSQWKEDTCLLLLMPSAEEVCERATPTVAMSSRSEEH